MAGTLFKSDMRIIKPSTTYYPEILLHTCKEIQKRAGTNMEWSILCKGAYTERGFEIGREYVIPHQEVTGSSVDFTDTAECEAYRTAGYNVIIHSHPFKSSSFSGSDMDTLSTNYDCSVLFSLGEFTTATLRLVISEDSMMIFDTPLVLLYTILQLPANVDELIRNKSYTQKCGRVYDDGFYERKWDNEIGIWVDKKGLPYYERDREIYNSYKNHKGKKGKVKKGIPLKTFRGVSHSKEWEDAGLASVPYWVQHCIPLKTPAVGAV
jgi:hypothetical protein